mmetsp:Transcript_40626/g.73152  ORF Transcript_40626/g.73152 Transcript_40626/m.73152 type:complete len:264 (+) Transcript_40626:1110-1901(+)
MDGEFNGKEQVEEDSDDEKFIRLHTGHRRVQVGIFFSTNTCRLSLEADEEAIGQDQGSTESLISAACDQVSPEVFLLIELFTTCRGKDCTELRLVPFPRACWADYWGRQHIRRLHLGRGLPPKRASLTWIFLGSRRRLQGLTREHSLQWDSSGGNLFWLAPGTEDGFGPLVRLLFGRSIGRDPLYEILHRGSRGHHIGSLDLILDSGFSDLSRGLRERILSSLSSKLLEMLLEAGLQFSARIFNADLHVPEDGLANPVLLCRI